MGVTEVTRSIMIIRAITGITVITVIKVVSVVDLDRVVDIDIHICTISVIKGDCMVGVMRVFMNTRVKIIRVI
jgi:hypothetical protein